MTDQLDPEAEARIREACGCSTCVGEMRCGPWRCKADDLRAFLKADREAHSCQYEEDARIKGNLIEVQAARIKHLEALETTERSHADALADALRTAVEMHSARYGREPDICARCGFSYQFEVDWLDEEFSVVFSLDSNPQLSPPGDYVLWSWIESTLVGHTAMPDLEISTTPAGSLFSQTSPANGSYYTAGQITSANPLTLQWSAYPQAQEYWVDLGLDGNDYALWSSDATQNRSIDFTGVLNNSTRITQGTYWWAVGSIRELNDFSIVTYTQTWTLYITP